MLLLLILLFVILIAALQLSLPVIDEVPADFPATLLWRFRLSSIGTEIVLWSVIGFAFGAMAEQVLSRGWPETLGHILVLRVDRAE